MKKLFVVLILICLGSILTLAQDSARMAENALADKKWALQFGIANNFTLTNFQSGGASIKKMLSPDKAFRLGVDFHGNFSGDDQIGQSTPGDTFYIPPTHDTNFQSIAINSQWIWYPNPAEDVLFFYGFGPSVSFTRTRNTNEDGFRLPQNIFTSRRESRSWGVGLNGVCGVEWFATRSISLSAEYVVGLMYSWQMSESSSQRSTDTFVSYTEFTQHSIALSSSSVRFGVSAYFNM
jgi:hypothetical protein